MALAGSKNRAPYFDTIRTSLRENRVTDVSSHDTDPVIVDEVSPVLIIAVLAGFWLMIGLFGYLALG
jgi:hypothetical protein